MTRSRPGRVAVEALLIAAASSVVGLAVNAARSAGLPIVARAPYQTMVPCPEPGGPVTAVEAAGVGDSPARAFLVDARSRAEFDLAHLEGAVNLPYDWLDPVPEADLRGVARAIAGSRATRVVVYGDGGRPDSGEHLAREISGRGIKNVCFVRGGAPAVLAGGTR